MEKNPNTNTVIYVEPSTYWEHRTLILEESIRRLFKILIDLELSPVTQNAVRRHFENWNQIIENIK